MSPRDNSYGLSETAVSVGRSVLSAEASGETTDLHAISATVGIPVEDVSDAVSELLDAGLVVTHARFGGTPYVSAKPNLARALEGHLTYSPAADDERVLSALVDAGRDIMVTASDLGGLTGLEPTRLSESIARLEHDGKAEVLRQIGRSDYAFTQACATARARRTR